MKKKLIATAVAGALVAPAAMAAEHANVTPYFRINNALELRDSDDPAVDKYADIANVSSRIGIRGSADLGNGTTVFGQYEFSTFTDREGTKGGRGGINDTRIGLVGVRGSFGAVSVGNQWSAFYNTIGTHMDPTYTVGYVMYSSQVDLPYRQSNAIKYANSFGAINLEVDTRFAGPGDNNLPGGGDTEKIGGDNGKDGLDGWGVGASWGITDAITVAAAYDSELMDVGDDYDRYGVAAKFSFGSFWLSGGYARADQGNGLKKRDLYTVYAGMTYENGGAYVGYQGTKDVQAAPGGATRDPSQFILHADYKLGGGPLRLYYEGTFVDQDSGAGGPFDFNRHLLGMRIDL